MSAVNECVKIAFASLAMLWFTADVSYNEQPTKSCHGSFHSDIVFRQLENSEIVADVIEGA